MHCSLVYEKRNGQFNNQDRVVFRVELLDRTGNSRRARKTKPKGKKAEIRKKHCAACVTAETCAHPSLTSVLVLVFLFEVRVSRILYEDSGASPDRRAVLIQYQYSEIHQVSETRGRAWIKWRRCRSCVGRFTWGQFLQPKNCA